MTSDDAERKEKELIEETVATLESKRQVELLSKLRETFATKVEVAPTPEQEAISLVFKEAPKDMVNSPGHYAFSIKPVEAIESWDLNFNRGCIVKYAARAGKKSKDTEIEDLKKIVYYASREIERLSSINDKMVK